MIKPDGLEDKGSRLWDAVCAEVTLDAAGYALLEDICRTTDIIARLTKRLNSKPQEWVKLAQDANYLGDGTKLLIVIDNGLTEIRQQRLALRQMWQHLGLGKVMPKGKKSKNLWDMSAFEEDMKQKG